MFYTAVSDVWYETLILKEGKNMTMLDYIAQQPSLFQSALNNKAEIAAAFCELFSKSEPDNIYLIASGTSRNGAAAAAPFMEMVLGCHVHVLAPSCVQTLPGKKPLAVFISQGGNSTNTIAAIERLSDVPSLAMTGNPDGKVNTMCDSYMEIPCGEETAGPKTKGYTITIITLYLMALETAKASGRIDAAEYNEIVAALELAAQQYKENVVRTRAWVDANVEGLRIMTKVYLAGKRQGARVAEEGGLKLMETMLVPGVGYEFEEYLHGPTCSLDETVSGFYLLPVPSDEDYERMQRLVAYHRDLCKTVYTVGLKDSQDPRDCVMLTTGKWYTQPFEQILPMQYASAVIPGLLGIEDVGMKRFKALDGVLGIKYKKESH